MQHLVIKHLSTKGRGIAPLESGSKVEVIGALAGEEVLVEVGQKKRHGVFKGFLQEVIKPSPDRVTPRCVHVPHCGGCTWQQMDYGAQLQAKQNMVHNAFKTLIEEQKPEVLPIIGCPDPWRYRNKMEFSFSQTAAGKTYLGLVLAGGNGRVLNLTECHLTSQWMVRVVEEVRTWWEASNLAAYHHYRDTGHLRTLTVREAKQGKGKLVMLTVSGNPDFALTKEQVQGYVEALKRTTPDHETLSIFLRIQQLIKGSPTQFYEMHLSGPDHFLETMHIQGRALHFKVSPTSFFQPNTLQAEVLYNRSLSLLKDLPNARVYDLYCGTATISLALACVAKEVIGIELNPHAVMDAECNKELNQIQNLTLYKGDVGVILDQLKGSEAPSIAVVDPPRAGLDERALRNLLSLNAQQILYLSCYPPTQAENIQVLTQAGYRLVSVQPVDQFPHTMHVENIAYLERLV